MTEEIPTQSIHDAILSHRRISSSTFTQTSPRKLETIDTLPSEFHQLLLKDLSSPIYNHHNQINNNVDEEENLEEGEIREDQSEIILNYYHPHQEGHRFSLSSPFDSSKGPPPQIKDDYFEKRQVSPVQNIQMPNDETQAKQKNQGGKYSSEIYYSSPTTPIVTFSHSGPNLYLSVDDLPDECDAIKSPIVHLMTVKNPTPIKQVDSDQNETSPYRPADVKYSTESILRKEPSVSQHPDMVPLTKNVSPSAMNCPLTTKGSPSIPWKESKMSSLDEPFDLNSRSFLPVLSVTTPSISSSKRNNQPQKTESIQYEILFQEANVKHAKEIDLLQGEIETLGKKYETSLSSNAKLQSVLTEYEQAIKRMIGEMSSAKESYKNQIDNLSKEKGSIEVELKAIEVAYRDAKQRAEDYKIVNDGLRKNEDLLKQMMTELQNDIIFSEKRYETLKSHAEEKLESANNEISKMKSTYDKEVSSLKAKLVKTDFGIKSLEASVEQKTKENKELMAICDELIQKMDSKQ